MASSTAPAGEGVQFGAQRSSSVVGESSLDVHGLGVLKVYTILEQEMDSLNSLSGRESQAIGFFWGCFGAFVSALLAGLVSLPSNPKFLAVYVAVALALFVLSAWFAIEWYRATGNRNGVIERIKTRASTPVRLSLSARSPEQPHE